MDNEGRRLELRADLADRSKTYDDFVQFTRDLPGGFRAGQHSPVERGEAHKQTQKTKAAQRQIVYLLENTIPAEIKKAQANCETHRSCSTVVAEATSGLEDAKKNFQYTMELTSDIWDWEKGKEYTKIMQELKTIVTNLKKVPNAQQIDKKERADAYANNFIRDLQTKKRNGGN